MADIIHKAEYLHPGSLLPEETMRTLPERSVEAAVAMAPAGAFCFTLFDTASPPDLGPEFKVVPVRQNISGRYYLGGQVFTLPELRAWIDANGGDAAHFALYANVEGNGYTRAIRCVTGNWQFFTDDDVLLDPVDAQS